MIILGIETSCDETAAAVLTSDDNRVTILSNVVASSAKLQEKYGGVIPEQAAREQIKSIIPVIEEALQQAKLTRHPELDSGSIWIPSSLSRGPEVRNDRMAVPNIDAIAVTYGPGLIGSLLVGVETAKTLAKVWNKPLIPINHLLGHFYANWITNDVIPAKAGIYTNKAHGSRIKSGMTDSKVPTFPCLGLLVSGGHTDLVLFKDHGKYTYLGGTRDDAAGECFDKCARLLGLPYPGGPQLSELAQKGNPKTFDLPRPMIHSKDYDFSFSGLKTAVANIIHTSEVSLGSSEVNCNLAASIEQAIVDVLVSKTIKAVKAYGIKDVIVAGGVAANQKLASELKLSIANSQLSINLHIPPPELCTDNAAMVASAAFFTNPTDNLFSVEANPNLSLS